ncbi:PilN domain-containing protein [Desulfonatronospira sp.]|uniref:PilN domain-containing protein n=1 Tax=Desulfonatronospira sp. TaxID=1962951 RepID=UPI0025C25ADF|nr:PilN domain-containing protein [Desulfonatronospira sp.]
MIKINLLPHSRRYRVSQTEKQLVLALALLLILGILCTGMIVWTGTHVSSLEDRVTQKEDQRHELLQKVGHINRIKEQMEQMQSNIQAIREIRSIQHLPVRYIEALVRSLPEQRVWFESLDLDGNGMLEIRGVVMDNQVFAQYVDELRRSPYVHSVNTRRTSRRQVQDLDLVEFDFRVQAGEPIPDKLTLKTEDDQ